MKKKMVSIAVILAAAFAGLAFLSQKSEGLGLKSVKAEEGILLSTVRATGTVMSAREAQLSVSAPGRIERVRVKEGQTVAKGAVLMTLDAREAEVLTTNAEAALQEARETVEQMKRNVEGLRPVWRAGGASLQELQDAESRLKVALAAETKAEAEVRSAGIMTDKLRLRAPFAGIISQNSARAGEWAAPGVPLITLADTHEREIRVFVDESDAGLIAPGQSVEVLNDAFPGRTWNERVLRIAPAVQKEGTANTVMVHLTLESDAHALRLGQQVDARIETARRQNAVKLPFESLLSKDGRTFVAVMNDGKAHLVPVTTGIEDMTHVEIRDGIRPGQEVLLSEGKRVQEGQRIRVIRDGRQ